MEKVILKVYAKVNLGLDILGAYEDGYHKLDMLMTSVDIFDIVSAEKATACSVFMDGVLAGKSNTASKALKLLNEKFGICLRVDITKNIPMCAGLGGSSADASGVFFAAHLLFDIDLSELLSLALQVGCDVPYMIYGGGAEVEGKGEIIRPCILPTLNLLVVQKTLGAMTKEVYSGYDICPVKISTIQALLDSFAVNISKKSKIQFFNVLEKSATTLCPTIAESVLLMKSFSDNVFMSGSGSAVIGVFATIEDAENAANEFEKQNYLFAKAATTLPHGIEIL